MKSIIITAALMLTATSHAVVAEKFKCTLEIKDTMSNTSTKEDKEFFVARVPLSESPSPNVRLTAGQMNERLTFNTAKAELGANLNFYYKHAVKIDSNGKTIEARQHTCVGLIGDYCEKSGNGSGQVIQCMSGTVACIESEDPFDPNIGWAKTSVYGSTPEFNSQALAPITSNITNDSGNVVGIVNMSCHYLGTFL